MLLDRRQYLVKERVAFVKLTDTYDIFDPESGQQIGVAREEPPAWAKYGRLLVQKQIMPTTVNVYEDEGSPPVLTLRKNPTILRAKVSVTDAWGNPLGLFVQHYRSFRLSGGGFRVFDAPGNRVADVKGDWKGWNFQFLDPGGTELGVVTKTWAGLGKELFTTADNYAIALTGQAPAGPETAALLLAAGLAIDIVFKEGK